MEKNSLLLKSNRRDIIKQISLLFDLINEFVNLPHI